MKKIIVGCVAATALLTLLVVHQEKEKAEFLKDNNCVQVAYKASTVNYGTVIQHNGSVGTATITTPSSTTYNCDNGQFTF